LKSHDWILFKKQSSVCWCFPISVYCLSVVEVATCHIRRPLKMWEVPADSRQIYTPLFTHS